METVAENVEMNTPQDAIIPEEATPHKERPETPPLMKKLIEHCMELYEEYEKSEYRKKKIEAATEGRRIYEQYEDEQNKDYPWKNASNIELPLVAITIDNLEPRIVAGLIGKDPIVQFEMKEFNQKDQPTVMLEEWFNKELKNVVKVEQVCMNIVHSILCDGTVFPHVEYDIKKKKQREFIFQAEQISMNQMTNAPRIKEADKIVGDGVRVKLISMSDIYVADDIGTAEEWEEADKIRTVRPTYGELMRAFQDGVRGYMNIGPWLLQEVQERKKEDSDQTPGQAIDDVLISGKEVIPCIECHITYPIYRVEEAEDEEQTDFREEKIIATIATKSKTLIRLVKLIDVNMMNESVIKRIRLYPEEGKSYGTGIYGKMASIQDGASDIFNNIVNAAVIGMMPWYFHDDSAGIKGKQEIFPGAGVACDNVNGIKEMTFNSNPEQHLAVLNFLVTLWERIGSIGDYQIGQQGMEKRTATEVMAVIQEGNIKHNYQARVTKEEFITVLRTVYDLYYKYLPPNKTFVFQGQMVPIPRQAMQRDFRFVLNGSTDMANKMIERKNAEDFYTVISQNPLADPIKPLVELIKAYEKDDPESYINPQLRKIIEVIMQNPEVVQVIGQYMQTKAQVTNEVTGGKQPPGGGPGGGRTQPTSVQ